MKPIEEGCKAVIVNSRGGNNGKIVNVGKFIGDPKISGYISPEQSRSHWEISPPLPSVSGSIGNTVSEYLLLRIDDEDTTTWEHVAETIGFIPNKQTVEEK